MVWRGSGTILLVDDEDPIRAIGARMLRHLGFDVLLASDGDEAVELFRQHKDEITCVLLDLTMPRMDGEEALGQLRRINSDVCTILASGYGESEIAERFAGKRLAGFLHKPYSLSDLSDILRRALSESRELSR